MSSPLTSGRRLEGLALLLAVLSVAAGLLLGFLRGSWSAVAGDESTFLAMSESLARDGDLSFEAADRARLEADPERARQSVILQRAGERIAYSKPVVYPLLAAPLFRMVGPAGLVALNGIGLTAALVLFWSVVRSTSARGRWALTVVTFGGAGVVLAQVGWATSDALQLALALAGGTLAIRSGDSRLSDLAAGAMLGALIPMRLPNAILVLAVVGATALGGSLPKALRVGGAAAAGLAIALALNFALIGAFNPYRAERATFTPETGYPAGYGADRALEQFEVGRATQRLGAVPQVRPRSSAYAGLYFLIGRHTGLLLYLPAALVLFGSALWASDRAGRTLLMGVVGLAAFYLIWMPENYFGGEAFVGNRYVLPAYGLLLPALVRPPRVGGLLIAWTVAAATLGSAVASVARESELPYSSQSHAHAGVFRWLPYESTALAIEPRADRYYSDEFLRFTDRNARPRAHGFHLLAGAPPAEILLATPRPSGILRFLALADRPRATIVFHDWRGRRRVELTPHPDGARGVLEIVAAPAWRRHGFWWSDGVWRAHALRLALETPDDSGGRVDLRYLGPYRLASKFFEYEIRALDLPEVARAGDRERLRVSLVNRGLRPWRSEADVPIHLTHRIVPADGGEPGLEPIAYTPIAGPVEQSERVDLEIEVRWPTAPGRYRLVLDLAAGGVEPFAAWLGQPLADHPVEVAR